MADKDRSNSYYTEPDENGIVYSRYDFDFEEDVANSTTHAIEPEIDLENEEVFRQALVAMNESGILYAVGAAFARYSYTGIWRNTKDLDIYVRPEDLKATFTILIQAGFKTHVEHKHWLAKGRKGKGVIDIIFGTGHGQLPIDDCSFEGSQIAEVLGVETRLYPIEEMLASAMYVAERRRFDGAEVIHLIYSTKGNLDWERIQKRLGDNRELILWHFILFDFVYPGHRSYMPRDLFLQLLKEARENLSKREDPKAFRGSLIDPFSFTVDIEDWGFEDRRKLKPLVDKNGVSLQTAEEQKIC